MGGVQLSFRVGKKTRRENSKSLSIEQGNIISFDADVVALKYAQGFYGVDGVFASALNRFGISDSDINPSIGESVYIKTRKSTKVPNVLFVGVPPFWKFGYQEIREFAVIALKTLSQKAPTTRHLAMKVHGPGYGLDEFEALFAQFAGYWQVIQDGNAPPGLEAITIVEYDSRRVERLRQGFEENIVGLDNVSKVKDRWAYRLEVPQRFRGAFRGVFEQEAVSIKSAGLKSEEKPHAFVAIPFQKDMEDVFYYGIQSAAHANNLLCERIDQEAFTGDIIERVKKKIETAAVVIAELTGANPNVYLEVGYAWGKEIPTVLLVKKPEELSFDVRGQRCLKYEIIRELEETLTKELTGLLQI
jgi:hypothetical protein